MASIFESMQMAIAHHRAGRLEEAEGIYRQVLAVEPRYPQAWHLLGVIANQVGRHEVAAECLGRAVALAPEYAEAHCDLGNALKELGKREEAIASIRRGLAMKPGYAEGHYNLGNALREQGKNEEAIASYRRAVELRPEMADAHGNLGLLLKDEGKMDEAAGCFRRALELEPEVAEAHINLGLVFHEQRKLDEAIACYRRAVALAPNYAEGHSNLGFVLYDRGEFDEAAACYARALELQPEYAEAHWNLARLQLLRGDFARGWREYEWHWRLKKWPPRPFPQPMWDGGDLAGKTILLHAEQGLGDTIQFVRYARLVKEQGARVVLECQPALVRLLSGLPVDQVVARGGELPAFDVHAPLMSLPRILETRLSTIPADVPYLFVEPELVEKWQERLNGIDAVSERHGGRSLQVGLRERLKGIDAVSERHGGRSLQVAIGWQGNPANSGDRERSFRLAEFAGLADVPGVRLISLQKGAGTEQLADAAFPVVDFGSEVDEAAGAFMDSAAILMNVDLVVTADSALAHLAGALGVPVWVGLPLVPDWRWMLERGDSPWYPTMRLFRQRRAGDWAGVFEEMRGKVMDHERHE